MRKKIIVLQTAFLLWGGNCFAGFRCSELLERITARHNQINAHEGNVPKAGAASPSKDAKAIRVVDSLLAGNTQNDKSITAAGYKHDAEGLRALNADLVAAWPHLTPEQRYMAQWLNDYYIQRLVPDSQRINMFTTPEFDRVMALAEQIPVTEDGRAVPGALYNEAARGGQKEIDNLAEKYIEGLVFIEDKIVDVWKGYHSGKLSRAEAKESLKRLTQLATEMYADYDRLVNWFNQYFPLEDVPASQRASIRVAPYAEAGIRDAHNDMVFIRDELTKTIDGPPKGDVDIKRPARLYSLGVHNPSAISAETIEHVVSPDGEVVPRGLVEKNLGTSIESWIDQMQKDVETVQRLKVSPAELQKGVTAILNPEVLSKARGDESNEAPAIVEVNGIPFSVIAHHYLSMRTDPFNPNHKVAQREYVVTNLKTGLSVTIPAESAHLIGNGFFGVGKVPRIEPTKLVSLLKGQEQPTLEKRIGSFADGVNSPGIDRSKIPAPLKDALTAIRNDQSLLSKADPKLIGRRLKQVSDSMPSDDSPIQTKISTALRESALFHVNDRELVPLFVECATGGCGTLFQGEAIEALKRQQIPDSEKSKVWQGIYNHFKTGEGKGGSYLEYFTKTALNELLLCDPGAAYKLLEHEPELQQQRFDFPVLTQVHPQENLRKTSVPQWLETNFNKNPKGYAVWIAPLGEKGANLVIKAAIAEKEGEQRNELLESAGTATTSNPAMATKVSLWLSTYGKNNGPTAADLKSVLEGFKTQIAKGNTDLRGRYPMPPEMEKAIIELGDVAEQTQDPVLGKVLSDFWSFARQVGL